MNALGTASFRIGIALCAASLFGCAALPAQRGETPTRQGTSLTVEQRLSPNFDARRPNFVIIHHTSDGNAEEALDVLTDRERKVSAHYLIGRDGKLFQLVDEAARAWHAGESYWGGQRDMNSASIGIELDNDGNERFAEAQIETLVALLSDLKLRYSIPTANFLGHADIAPGRKTDPSRFFPWKRLAEQGFGLWCDPPYPPAPADVDTETLLQSLGYNVWNVDATISAFKLHFSPEDPTRQMSDNDRSMLYCLVLQKRSVAAQ
ncbi:MAG: N-acetylmuramoyl-L-alanine amidase [Burkholderiales bacterium]